MTEVNHALASKGVDRRRNKAVTPSNQDASCVGVSARAVGPLNIERLTALQRAVGNNRTYAYLQSQSHASGGAERHQSGRQTTADWTANNPKTANSVRASVTAKPVEIQVEAALERAADVVANRIVPWAAQPSGGADRRGSHAPTEVDSVLRSPGLPLERDMRDEMEGHFNFDLGQIRIHSDEASAQSARAIDAQAYASGSHLVFAQGAYQPKTSAGRWLLAHELTHVQQQAEGAPLELQRWTNPIITLKNKDQLLQDGANGDITAINQLSAADYASATDDQRFRMIDHLNARGTGRWGRDVSSLEQLWDSFGARLSTAVASDRSRWESSMAIDIGLTSSISFTRQMRDDFPIEVAQVVTSFLFSNRDFVMNQMQSLNIPLDPSAAPAPPDANETQQIEEAKLCAGAIARTQRAQEEVRNKVFVGYERTTPSASAIPVEGAPIIADPTTHYVPVRFDPTSPPQFDKPPAATGLLENVIPSPSPLQPYKVVKEKYDAATEKVQVLLGFHPELYAIVREGTSEATAGFAQKDAATARRILGEQLHSLFRDIEKSQQALDDGTLNPLDLTPVHAKLVGGYRGPGVKRDWADPLAQSVVKSLVADHEFEEALKQLGMQFAAQALFMFAPLAAEGALALMLAGLAVTAAKAQMSADRFEALQAAAKSAPQAGTELVPVGAVERAQAIKDADEVALILAAIAVGLAVAGELLSAIRASSESPAELGTRLAAEAKGQPSKFDFICQRINAAGLSQADAATAAESATRGIGLRLIRVTIGDDVILGSVMPGTEMPVLIVRPSGAILRGTADIAIAQPLSLEHPVIVSNVRPNGPSAPGGP